MKFVCKAYRYTGRVRGQVDWFNGPREHLAGCRAWREKRPAAVNGAGRGVESHGRAHRRERKNLPPRSIGGAMCSGDYSSEAQSHRRQRDSLEVGGPQVARAGGMASGECAGAYNFSRGQGVRGKALGDRGAEFGQA